MKKILILSLIVCSLLLLAVDPAVAADKTFEDDRDDVIDEETQEYTNQKPNIDVTQLTYSIDDKTVTLKLTVKGDIEKRGDLDTFRIFFDPIYSEEILGNLSESELEDFISNLNFDLVEYSFWLMTSLNNYYIVYVNDDILAYSDTEDSLATTYSIDDSDITVTFDLSDNTEKPGGVAVETMDLLGSFLTYNAYSDDLEGEWEDDGNDGNDGTNGNPNDNDGQTGSLDSGLLMFVAIIAIIVVVGVVIVVYIIRR